MRRLASADTMSRSFELDEKRVALKVGSILGARFEIEEHYKIKFKNFRSDNYPRYFDKDNRYILDKPSYCYYKEGYHPCF